MIEHPDRGYRKQQHSFDGTMEDPTLEVKASDSRDSASSKASTPTRGPSSGFLKRRHERMRERSAASNKKEEEEEEKKEELAVDTTQSQPEEEQSSALVSPTTASSTALRSFQQFRAKRKNRVPGGAAAKLIGKVPIIETPEEDEDEDALRDEPLEVPAPTDEFIRMRDEAKAVFSTGNKDNRRYHATETTTDPLDPPKIDRSNSAGAESHTTHRVLNRDEAYHENATASVLSLLNGSETPTVIHTGPVSSKMADSSTTDFTQKPAIEAPTRNAFQAPPRMDDASVVSKASSVGHHTTASSMPAPVLASEELEPTTKGRNPLEQPLLSKKAEQRVAQMKKQMRDPDAKLSDLIANIASPDEDNSEDAPAFTRGYMVRRKNACGALQVLTAKNTHRVQICWTVGVLPALSSVLADSGEGPLEENIRDLHTRSEFVEARKRAVSSLMNLSMPQDNRLAVFHTPNLISNVVRVIRLDHREARKGCCAVLAHLAKTKENRLLMVQVPGLIDAITSVIEPKAFVTPTTKYSEEDEEEDDATYDSHNSSTVRDNESTLRASSTHEESVGDDTRKRLGSSFSSQEEDSERPQDLASNSTFESAVEEEAEPQGDDDEGEALGGTLFDKASRRYDTDPNEHLHGARINVFALLSHLFKEKDNAYILARHAYLTETLVAISKLHDSPSHEHAVKLMAHLTRHRGNSKQIVFKVKTIVPALVRASFSQNDESRKHACFALQNLAQDKPCRQELAITEGLLTAICVRIRQASDPEERLAAIQTIKNLTDEPANLIPMTNTSECFATLMQIAHASDDTVTQMMQYLGCDALATLSHWFRSIATSGQRIELTKQGLKPTRDLFVPSLQIVTFEQWK